MIHNNCSLTGIILKPHGREGNLIIRLFTVDADNIEPGSFLFIDTDGTLIPYCLSEITPKKDSAVIKLEFINSLDEAQKFTGRDFYLHNDLLKRISTFQPDIREDYIGFSFFDQASGITGIVEKFTEDEFNPLFLIKTGGNRFLVPAQPGLIISIDNNRKEIIADLPEGLTEL